MAIDDWFSASYGEARAKFLAAAQAAGADLTSYPHPLKGPDGGDLALDLAYLGPPDAAKVLVTASATHGVEGFCGSGCQVGFLEDALHGGLPGDMAVMHVHAHNPHGFAHERRVTEDNVDLNRNFVDFSAPLPENSAYDEVHPWLVPDDWDGPARQAADAAIEAFIDAHGMFAFQAAVSGGQHGHPDGLFFGGQAPTWSRQAIERLAREHLRGRSHVALIDFHTGLGPRGFGELISVDAPGGPEHLRTVAWYGDEVRIPGSGDSVSAKVNGTIETGYHALLENTESTTIAIEFGTLPPEEVLQALRADNWLYLHGDVASPVGREIKRQVRAAFYGEDSQWNDDVWQRGLDIARKTVKGLSES
ncbi:MAG: M14 family metallopeptidase [Alphaproteobacteria bacterium]|nr:M14 family metallopeptidase [Alphaproteobacteria bacterium]